ncbi:hypothetical protein P8452_73481 [Trifolium repens]|nr:hypothetical protein P8452_73481 [Trifolium repens]
MVSGLKVNFWKSSLMGVNVSNDFLRLASIFLNCKIGVVPFKYLGLPVGANIRRALTWEPLISSLRKRLGNWNNKFVSLGGRIVLLNSVLNAIPIFYLSYLKIPVLVWKQVRRIQREFLWGARNGNKKINWVKWEDVCKPKTLGGLGVRDIRAVNISLLTKWRRRLLFDDDSIWKGVIRSKYGEEAIGRVEVSENCTPWFSSLWWKDITSIGSNLDVNWFSKEVVKVIGDGRATSFWKDTWVGERPFETRFPRLFSISSQKEASVAAVWAGAETVGWNFQWRRRLFAWEEEQVEQLMDVVNAITLSDFEDKWRWKSDVDGEFSVKSTYALISNLSAGRGNWDNNLAAAFKALWNCPAPSKVLDFSWMLLHNKIPTKDNLFRRQIINGNDQLCVFCGTELETSVHLFIYCPFALNVWEKIHNWLALGFMLPQNLVSLLHFFAVYRGQKKRTQGLLLIWNAVVWAIWRKRNRILFENDTAEVIDLVEEIKVSSWRWWIARTKSAPCLMYEWSREPLLCMV